MRKRIECSSPDHNGKILDKIVQSLQEKGFAIKSIKHHSDARAKKVTLSRRILSRLLIGQEVVEITIHFRDIHITPLSQQPDLLHIIAQILNAKDITNTIVNILGQ